MLEPVPGSTGPADPAVLAFLADRPPRDEDEDEEESRITASETVFNHALT